jgi:hypothetical protein
MIFVYDADNGYGQDGKPQPVYQADSDFGTGSESWATALADQDYGTGAEAAAIVAEAFSDTDSGTGDDSNAAIYVTGIDLGAGSDAGYWEPPGFYLIVDSDRGRFQEGDIEPAADADSGIGIDAAFMAPSDSEYAFGSDTVLVFGSSLAGTDAGGGADAEFMAPSDTDTAAGSDGPEYAIGIFPSPPPWLFGETGRAMQFAWPVRAERSYRLTPRDMHLISDADAAEGDDVSRSTATITQYATWAGVLCTAG